MTAEVFRAIEHEHNHWQVAEQEYEASKGHYHEVLTRRIAGNADHDRRFRDAAERLEVARERWLDLLVSG